MTATDSTLKHLAVKSLGLSQKQFGGLFLYLSASARNFSPEIADLSVE
jgi:hypothetical protein